MRNAVRGATLRPREAQALEAPTKGRGLGQRLGRRPYCVPAPYRRHDFIATATPRPFDRCSASPLIMPSLKAV